MCFTQQLEKRMLVSVSLVALLLGVASLVTSCDSPTGSRNADDGDIVLGDGDVVVTDLPPDSLSVGENAIFTLSVDLPGVSGSVEGYRVWVYPTSGDYESYCFRNSDVLNPRETGVSRYAYPKIEGEECSERTAGTVDAWRVHIDQWDGDDNLSFALYDFDHTVVWE